MNILRNCFCILTVLTAVSCATAPRDTVYSRTAAENNIRAADEIERSLAVQHIHRSSGGMDAVKQALDGLAAVPSTDPEQQAWLYALYADYYLLQGERQTAKKMLITAARYHKDHEYVHLVTSRLLSKPEARRDALRQAVNTLPESFRLQAELGHVLFLLAQYTEALVAFDASLPFLPEEYTLRFGGQRDECQARYTAASGNGNTDALLEKKELLLADMAAVTQKHTRVLDFITGTAAMTPRRLAEQLKQRGWFTQTADLAQGTAKRCDSALFLWYLLTENTPDQRTRYSSRYNGKKQSPIEDVPLSTVYFDSILGVVEEDIMPLIDGKKFIPEGQVSGLEFYKWVKKAEEIVSNQ